MRSDGHPRNTLMALHPLHASFTVSWLSHDCWSEAFVGTRHLIYDVLPPSIHEQRAEDGALCQLALISAHHLMEIALFKLIKPYVTTNNAAGGITQKKYEEASYWLALSQWVESTSGKALPLTIEPFISTERLRARRNATIHKSSALATVKMARSALFSVTDGTKALYSHFGEKFPYEPFLDKYPLPIEQPFSVVDFPPGS